MITQTEYTKFQQAYDFYNKHLFNDSPLPAVMITLQRKPKMRGYFWAEQYQAREGTSPNVAELALNPDTFAGRSDKCILSTLVHEMVHVWQHYHGVNGKKGYHNKEWGAKMKLIGLHPSNTGEPGGKETGEKMTHYIMNGRDFDIATDNLLATGFSLGYQSTPVSAEAKKKKQTRAKYTCPECDLNAWAKPDAMLCCAGCSDPENMVMMVCEESNED